MRKSQSLLFLILCFFQVAGCSMDKSANKKAEGQSSTVPWWQSMTPIFINGDEFYGKSCSITRVNRQVDAEVVDVIFNVPWRLATFCRKSEGDKNDLEYDGTYLVLHASRQTIGAGSWTRERYRSADRENWEEYIGVTWKNGEEYEAWRMLGSTSSEEESINKVDPEQPSKVRSK